MIPDMWPWTTVALFTWTARYDPYLVTVLSGEEDWAKIRQQFLSRYNVDLGPDVHKIDAFKLQQLMIEIEHKLP